MKTYTHHSAVLEQGVRATYLSCPTDYKFLNSSKMPPTGNSFTAASSQISSATPVQPVTTEYMDRKFQDLENKFMTMIQAKNEEIVSLSDIVSSLKSKV